MIKSVIYLRSSLDRLVDMDRHNQISKTAIRRFKLTATEWNLLTELEPVLDVGIQNQFKYRNHH